MDPESSKQIIVIKCHINQMFPAYDRMYMGLFYYVGLNIFINLNISTITTNTTCVNIKGFERKLQVAYLVHLLNA